MTNLIGESGYYRKELDAYWTRPWCTEWVLAALPRLVRDTEVVWEPACGMGHISKVLHKHGYDVLSTDCFMHGWDGMHGIQDFMEVGYVDPCVQAIVTNPPYDIKDEPGFRPVTAEQFVRHAIDLMKPVGGKVLMILRNEFDCAKGRIDLFNRRPFAAKLVLTKRPEWTDDSMPVKEKSSPRHNYAWFYWDWEAPGPAIISMLPKER